VEAAFSGAGNFIHDGRGKTVRNDIDFFAGMSTVEGGTGKTSCAGNIAVGLARQGHKTVLIDCDQQENASSRFITVPYVSSYADEEDRVLQPEETALIQSGVSSPNGGGKGGSGGSNNSSGLDIPLNNVPYNKPVYL
jgi:hypothetical protein